MSKNILFITETLFKERTGASTAIDGKQIFPIIKVAQDIYIQGALGSTLYKRLQDGIEDDDLNNSEKELLDDYITDTLVWYTMSLLPMSMGFQLFSKGFLQKTAEESTAPSRSDLELIEARYSKTAEYYKTRLIKYLQENYTSFWEYLNNTQTIDTIFPESRGYTCPIYIGEDNQPKFINSSSSTLTLNVANYIAVGGENSFAMGILSNRQVLAATRSGLAKVVTESVTIDTGYLQITGGVVTLATGDVAIVGELFTFLYK